MASPSAVPVPAIVLAAAGRQSRPPHRLRDVALVALAKHPMVWGVLLMLLANGLWALAYIAPLVLPEASAVEIALGRFIVYGLLSAALVNMGRVLRLPLPVLALGVLFALAGNVVYYLLLVIGIQLAGAAMAVLIIGMLPVTIALAGRIRADRPVLRRLAFPLVVFAVGIVLFNAARTGFFADVSQMSWIGLACVLASLGLWTWYAVANGRFLGRTRAVSAADWSSVVGLASLVVAATALPVAWWLGLARDPASLDAAEFFGIAVWSLLLGAGSTWLGTVLFNLASRLLDISVVGQLIVFEAVFGMAYLFALSGDLPTPLELLGITLAIGAVWLSIRRLTCHTGAPPGPQG